MVTNLRSLGTATPSALYGFFAATVLTFGLLCLAGWLSTTRNQFEHFQRFHLYINPQTLFYPTASQVVMLAKDAIPKDRVGVIVGGSSVVWGAGQSEAELWTRHLQET